MPISQVLLSTVRRADDGGNAFHPSAGGRTAAVNSSFSLTKRGMSFCVSDRALVVPGPAAP